MPRKPVYKSDSIRHIFHRFLVGEETEDGETRAFCPVCEDPETSSSPSASFNIPKNIWSCRGHCATGGRIDDLIKLLRDEKSFDVRSERMKGVHSDKEAVKKYRASSEAQKSYKSTGDSLPTDEQVADWNKRLLNSPAALAVMTNERGLTVDTLAEWAIGWDGQRYTIPVYDVDGNLANVRRYKPKASAASDKMLNIPGYGTARLFRPDILRDSDTIVLCEGEMDCVILNQIGIPAITHTAGAMTFRKQWALEFEGKTVYVCYDNDDSGRDGGARAAKEIGKYAASVAIITIPMPAKGADVTDFIVKEGHGREEFLELMNEAVAKTNSATAVRAEPPKDGRRASLEESMSEEHQQQALEMTVTISGKQNPPFYAPRRVEVNCDMSKGPVCTNCPVFLANGDTELKFQPDDPTLFRFLDIGEDRQRKLFKELSGARCTDHVEFDPSEYYTMEELIVSNAIDDRDPGEDQAPITRRIFSVGTHKTPVNTTVRILGANVADPKNGRQSFMAWKNEPTQTTLDRFEMTPELRDDLVEFQPVGDQSPLDRCREIAHDMEQNVTKIYGRSDLHVAYDLVWHSPIAFVVDGRVMDKGWLEMMVVGDTRTGKSEASIQLAKHYGAGVVKSCEGATFAGLVGGVQQIGNNWTTTWGIIPLNDRRLVVLDEVSGLSDRDVIENMSSIRSSGRAQITKIAVEETSARTRLIWITNPGDGSMIADHPDAGIAALRTVVKANEDIARFDFVMAATASEVDTKLINSPHARKDTPHVFNSKICQSLVMWAWSRRPDQVQFTKAAVRRGMDEAAAIAHKYVPDPPLLQSENARFKIYRIAAAIAARTFSTQDGEVLLVTDDHVIDAVRFLDEIYAFEGMGYARRSKRAIESRKEASERRTACKMYLLANSDTVLHALRSIGGTTFRVRDFKEMAGMMDSDGQEAAKKLLGWKMISRKSRGDLVMNSVLVDILREIDDLEHDGGL